MSEKRFTSFVEDDGYWIRDENDFKIIATGLKFGVAENLIAMLNKLNDENQLLKCALALDAITNISLNDKKVDIQPYYEFGNYQQLKKERREEYDEYW